MATAASLYFPAATTDSIGAIVPLAQSGTNAGAFNLATYGASAHLIVDVTGYYTAHDGTNGRGGTYIPNEGGRILDTRVSPNVALAPQQTKTITVAGNAGVPSANASAVALSVAVMHSTSNGWLTAFRPDKPQPAVGTATIIANRVNVTQSTVELSENGQITFYNGGSAPVNLVVDVQGWYSGSPTPGTRFIPVANEQQFITAATGHGVPRDIAEQAVFDEELARMIPVRTVTRSESQAIPENAPMIEDGYADDGTSSTTSYDPPPKAMVTTTIAPADGTEPETYLPTTATNGTCKSGYKLYRGTEKRDIYSVVGVKLYWLALDKRWCAKKSTGRIGSWWASQRADVTAAADSWIEDKGTDEDQNDDLYLRADGVHSRSGHLSVRLRVFRYCAIRGLPLCYNTAIQQGFNAFWDGTMQTWTTGR